MQEIESGINDKHAPDEEALEASQSSVCVLQAKRNDDEFSPSFHSSQTHISCSSADDSDGSSNSLQDTSHFVPTDDLEGSFALMDELIVSQGESSSFLCARERNAEYAELEELSCIPDPECCIQAENGAVEQLLCPAAPEDCQAEPMAMEKAPCSRALDDGHAVQAPIAESMWPLTQEHNQAELSLTPELPCPPAKANDNAGVMEEPCPSAPEQADASENPPLEGITCPSAPNDGPAELLPIADLPEKSGLKPLQRSVSVGTGDDWMGSIPDSSINSSRAHMVQLLPRPPMLDAS